MVCHFGPHLYANYNSQFNAYNKTYYKKTQQNSKQIHHLLKY